MVETSVVIRRLQVLASQLGSQKALAKKLKVSEQYLSDVMLGRSEPGPAILKGIGYERIVLYKELKS